MNDRYSRQIKKFRYFVVIIVLIVVIIQQQQGIHVLSLDTMSWTHPVVAVGPNPFPRVCYCCCCLVDAAVIIIVIIIII